MAIAETLETLEQLTQSFTDQQDEIIARLENCYERSLDENDSMHQVVNFYIALSRQTSESPLDLYRRATRIFRKYASECKQFSQQLKLQIAKGKKSYEKAVYETSVLFSRLIVDGWRIFPPSITQLSQNFYQVLREAQTAPEYRKHKGFDTRHQTEREIIEEALLILLEFIPQTDTETSQIQAMMKRAKQRASQIQDGSSEKAKADFIQAWDAISQSRRS